MMKIFSIVSWSALVSYAVASDSSCSSVESTIEDRGYHSRCDLHSFNAYKAGLGKDTIHQRLLKTGYSGIPNQRTTWCPQSIKAPESRMLGQDTVWFVENTLDEPVLVSIIHGGVERSAVNRKLAATEDPEAILKPKEWKAVHAFEGEVFYIKTLGDQPELLLEHQVGLIAVGEKLLRESSPATSPVAPQDIQAREKARPFIAPKYEWKTCNVVDVGFRNQGIEPLQGFWVDPATCQEHFKFQLGINANSQNFAFDPDSNTKFEKTYVGHTFTFRSASTGALVDRMTIQPIQIGACPLRRKVSQDVVIGQKDSIVLPIATNTTNHLYWNRTTEGYGTVLYAPPVAAGGARAADTASY